MSSPLPERRRLHPTDAVELAAGPVEVGWVDGDRTRVPVVLLHEGLGCVAMWRDFPYLLAEAMGRVVMAYSRHGYGGSAPAALPRPPGYMHVEGLEVLPALLAHLEIGPSILVGHSDGASIALIAAAGGVVDVVALGLLAPHVFVEERSVASIAAVGNEYLGDDRLRSALGRYHQNPDATFWGWNDVWLSPAFRTWNIEAGLGAITVPVAAVQGDADPYGTMAQLDAIGARVGGPFSATELSGVGHAPHRERPAEVLAALAATFADLP